MRACVLDEVEYPRYRRLAVRLGGLYPQRRRHIYRRAEYLIADLYRPRQALARECRDIYIRYAVKHLAVNSHALAGVDEHNTSDLDLLGRERDKLAVSLDDRLIGAYLHKRADAPSALSERDALKKLARLVKEHYRHRLKIVSPAPNGKDYRADRGYRHKEILVKKLTVYKSACR